MGYRRKHDRHVPRGWFGLFLRLGGWVCLLAGAGLLILTFVSAISLRVADRLDAEAGYAVATITGKSLIGDADAPEAWRVTFTYKTEAGGRTAEAEVSTGFYQSARIGAEVPVRYLRADPGAVVLEPAQNHAAGILLRYSALGLGLVGLVTLWLFGAQANAAILARRDGEKRMARVVAIKPTGVKVNERAQGRLTWREEDGQTGESLMRAAADLKRLYKPGDTVVVFRRRGKAYWEGDVGPPARESEN